MTQFKINRRNFLAGAAALPLVGSQGVQAAAPLVLKVHTRVLDVKGRAATVFGITNSNGKPGHDLVLGERFKVRVDNALSEDTVLHWHGLTPPNAQDGVPMLTQAPIKPGESFDYDFENLRAGTHWMHSHVGLQEQRMLAAPLIVRETAEPLFDEQEHVVLLHDFTFRDPAEILAELQGGGGGHAAHSMANMKMDHSKMAGGTMPMGMAGMVNDIVFDAMLANDRTLDDPEIVQAERGGAFRLRIINGAAASNMWVDLGQLKGQLIAVDGNAVVPVSGSLFPLAIAQRADIRLQLPSGSGAWPVLFRNEGSPLQSGIILRAGEGAVQKISDQGEVLPALDLVLEMQLQSIAQLRDEPVSRTEMLMLEGGGADYVWALNGKTGMHDTLFTVKADEHLEIMMHNMTSMAHPMHLHGHYFKVVAVDNQRINGAIRDTVLVPPMQSVSIQFDADNPGNWAFHCHHVYHMNSGMMGALTYTGAA